MSDQIDKTSRFKDLNKPISVRECQFAEQRWPNIEMPVDTDDENVFGSANYLSVGDIWDGGTYETPSGFGNIDFCLTSIEQSSFDLQTLIRLRRFCNIEFDDSEDELESVLRTMLNQSEIFIESLSPNIELACFLQKHNLMSTRIIQALKKLDPQEIKRGSLEPIYSQIISELLLVGGQGDHRIRIFADQLSRTNSQMTFTNYLFNIVDPGLNNRNIIVNSEITAALRGGLDKYLELGAKKHLSEAEAKEIHQSALLAVRAQRRCLNKLFVDWLYQSVEPDTTLQAETIGDPHYLQLRCHFGLPVDQGLIEAIKFYDDSFDADVAEIDEMIDSIFELELAEEELIVKQEIDS
jgi:hypothetical protein